MILYNVTIKLQNSIHNEWLHWLKNEHVPDIMQTECFTDFKILRLLEVDEAEGPTYAIQYFAESKAVYNRYIEKYANEMKQKSYDKWGNKFIAFRSLMQILN
ncbi:MAG: DUF4286 family protein [Ferruginibacter sp.]|nr:DUF4286 family protein [Ferruginibacter sp.]